MYETKPAQPQKTPRAESEQELFDRWDLPNVSKPNNKPRTNAYLTPQSQQPEQEEQVEVPALTAEALEEIRQAAYEEGLEQGLKEGREQGHAEGFASGIEDGKKQGFEEGRAQGLEQGAAEIEEKSQSLAQIIEALNHPQLQIDNQVEKELVELTTQISKAIVNHELKTNPQIILNSLKQAVDLLPFAKQTVRLQLNPSDLNLLQEVYSPDQIDQRGWLLEAEPTLPIGDLRLLTENSDVTINMQERQDQVCQIYLAQLNHNLKPEIKPQTVLQEPQIEEGESDEPNAE